MKNKALLLAALIFLAIAFVQFARLIHPFSVAIQGNEIPLWPNAIAFVVWGLLSAFMFRAWGEKEVVKQPSPSHHQETLRFTASEQAADRPAPSIVVQNIPQSTPQTQPPHKSSITMNVVPNDQAHTQQNPTPSGSTTQFSPPKK
jgi:hypothetical protein